MALGEKRKTHDGDSSDSIPALHPYESYLSSSRATLVLSADVGSSGALDLRPQRGRKSVRIVTQRSIQRMKTKETTMETTVEQNRMDPPNIVSHAEWIAARTELLNKEKEFTRLRDELSRQRRELPWEKVKKEYVFDGPTGKETLADLFDGKSQLLIYHFMLGPGWKEGCPSCSYLADHFDGMRVHLAARGIHLAVVSRAPWPEIEAFQQRMEWKFPWVSSNGTDFNFDYQVSATPGT